MNLAKTQLVLNLDDFKAAITTYLHVTANLTFTDCQNVILYDASGKVLFDTAGWDDGYYLEATLTGAEIDTEDSL